MSKKEVAVIGTGYVGLVTGACLADIGHRVVCMDSDPAKVRALEKGRIPIYEPGLEDVVRRNRKAGRLSFTGKLEKALEKAEIVFIAVNTPPLPNGDADLSFVETVARQVAGLLRRYTVVVEKSTVPVNTGEKVRKTLSLHGPKDLGFDVVSNPEFLREGSAVLDFSKPDRIVIGVESARAEKIMRELYAPIKAPLLVTDIKSAELIKHASNSFLALKISFINAVSQICERVGADVTRVAQGMGYDARIGAAFLKAGLGFGGSCFPKDLKAFIKMAEGVGYDFRLLKEVQDINHRQLTAVLEKLKKALWNLRGKTVAVWGLAFKPDTDDLRNAPALELIRAIQAEGAHVRAHDPVAMVKASIQLKNVKFCRTPMEAAKGADAVILATEWALYRKADLKTLRKALKTPVFIDARNVFSPQDMVAAGFLYSSIGRKN